ncbi:MAG: mechanosensitive ion channel domain-containing protein [Gemmatimonadaceae bacterium]
MNTDIRNSVDHFFDVPVFTIGKTTLTLAALILFGVVILVTVLAARLAERGTRRGFALRGVTDAGTAGVTARLVQYCVLLLGVGIALQTLGVNLGSLFAATAFFAVALGFAMQNVAENFVSGIILLTERTIKPGDVLMVEQRLVRVTRMGLRATVARTRDDEDLIIPNATLVQKTVTNYTLRDALFRIRTSVGVSYGADLAEVRRVLEAAASGLPARVPSHDSRILLTGFGDSAVNFEVSVWTHDPWLARVDISSLNEAIWTGLQAANISIPFPQRDLHIIQPNQTVSENDGLADDGLRVLDAQSDSTG